MIALKHDIELEIATADSRKAVRWKNERTTWQELVNRLSRTQRTEETVKEYFGYPKDKQDAIKDVGGFVGGHLRDGKRKKGHVGPRTVLTLDADYGSLELWDSFVLWECAGCLYTTHKHRPEAPRFRLCAPLSRPVDPDEYEALGRIIASGLDIDAFDDTTYQAGRMMYWPSTSKDGEFVFRYTDAPVMDVDTILAELPNWRDPTTWPASSRSRETVSRGTGGKAEDPDEKDGIIGAFCRAYPMHEALAEFLGDVYAPCEEMGENRYSLIGGTTAGGLVIYDDKFAYSHHSTDAVCGKLCNAFDLVRLHKFGDLDNEAGPGVAPTRLLSFKAMGEFAGSLGPVKREIVRARRNMKDDYDELEAEARTKAGQGDWTEGLEAEGRPGRIKNTIGNGVLILDNDERLAARFGFNEFEYRETAIAPLPWDKPGGKYPRPLSDSDDAQLRLYLEREYGITNKGQIADALAVVVRRNSYHPVREYLDGLSWDGTERLDTLFIDLFGAKDSAYTRAVTRKAFTGAVARIYSPGCKFDYVLVLIGDQGRGKSTALSKMGKEWFSDSMPGLTGKEALEGVQGNWIIELGELAGLRRADVDAVKHFVSKREDRFRVAYGKRVEHFARRCVFFGTTNEEDFLRDVTGNRRFWPVDFKGKTGRLSVWKYLKGDTVDQLWAEAKFRYEAGEPLYLENDEIERAASEIQDKHLERDDRGGLVREYLERPLPEAWTGWSLSERRAWLLDKGNVGTVMRNRVCVMEVWAEALGREPAAITRRDSYEISRIMKSERGWTPTSRSVRFPLYGVQKEYMRGGRNQGCNREVTKR